MDKAMKIMNSLEELDSSPATVYKVVKGFKDGEQVCLGSLSAGAIGDWSNEEDKEKKKTAGIRLLALSLVSSEETGHVRYGEANVDKMILVLRNKPHTEVERLIQDVLDFNGLTVKKAEEAKKD